MLALGKKRMNLWNWLATVCNLPQNNGQPVDWVDRWMYEFWEYSVHVVQVDAITKTWLVKLWFLWYLYLNPTGKWTYYNGSKFGFGWGTVKIYFVYISEIKLCDFLPFSGEIGNNELWCMRGREMWQESMTTLHEVSSEIAGFTTLKLVSQRLVFWGWQVL